MKIILDTCAILWIAKEPGRLSLAARNAIANYGNELFVSATSAFEISLKHRRQKLDLGMDPAAWWFVETAHHNLQVLPITDEITLASTALPFLHSDPCDRIILATAMHHSAHIITSDAQFLQYPAANVIW